MELYYGFPFRGRALEKLRNFLHNQRLDYDDQVQYSVCLMEGAEIAAAGSLDGNVLKDIAVSPAYQHEGLAARILTELITQAARQGQYHLFMFTKPENEDLFAHLGFYTIAQTKKALLMENRRDGISRFVAALQKPTGKIIGAIVANCNPFTKGHGYLIETVARQCDAVHLFILSEQKSEFPAELRRELAIQGTAHIPQVIVQPTGPYLISSVTFPEYFLKDSSPGKVNAELDLTIFAECFARPLGITRRFVGTEPYSPTTEAYNRQMKEVLPRYGIEVVEVPRLEVPDKEGVQAVSASRVRKLLREGNWGELETLVPSATYRYLSQHDPYKPS